MKNRRKSTKNGSGAQRPPNWWRTVLLVGAPLALVAIAVVIALTRMPTYRDLEVVGRQPAIVQVYLPG